MNIRENLEKINEENTVKYIFNEWKRVGNRCVHLNEIIQNGLDIIKEEDVKNWKKYVKEFEKCYKEVRNETYKLIKIKRIKFNEKIC